MASIFSRWSFAGLFKSKPATRGKARPQATPNPYHAVSIVPGAHACAAADRFKGQRFLSRVAPRLPLPTCDAPYCGCHFKHHKDRRVGPRRRSEIGMMEPAWSGQERRRTGGRRAEDR